MSVQMATDTEQTGVSVSLCGHLIFPHPKREFSVRQPRLDWILPDVVSKMEKLGFAAHDVIECLVHPKRTLPLTVPVDLPGRDTLPVLEDAAQRMARSQT